MNRENQPKSENLLGQLLDRLTFPWPGEAQTTIREKISTNTRREADEKLKTLNQETALSPTDVIKKIKPRVASWQFEKLLDHILLKRPSRLGNSYNLFPNKKTN